MKKIDYPPTKILKKELKTKFSHSFIKLNTDKNTARKYTTRILPH